MPIYGQFAHFHLDAKTKITLRRVRIHRSTTKRAQRCADNGHLGMNIYACGEYYANSSFKCPADPGGNFRLRGHGFPVAIGSFWIFSSQSFS